MNDQNMARMCCLNQKTRPTAFRNPTKAHMSKFFTDAKICWKHAHILLLCFRFVLVGQSHHCFNYTPDSRRAPGLLATGPGLSGKMMQHRVGTTLHAKDTRFGDFAR